MTADNGTRHMASFYNEALFSHSSRTGIYAKHYHVLHESFFFYLTRVRSRLRLPLFSLTAQIGPAVQLQCTCRNAGSVYVFSTNYLPFNNPSPISWRKQNTTTFPPCIFTCSHGLALQYSCRGKCVWIFSEHPPSRDGAVIGAEEGVNMEKVTSSSCTSVISAICMVKKLAWWRKQRCLDNKVAVNMEKVTSLSCTSVISAICMVKKLAWWRKQRCLENKVAVSMEMPTSSSCTSVISAICMVKKLAWWRKQRCLNNKVAVSIEMPTSSSCTSVISAICMVKKGVVKKATLLR